jgi:hypothetical protein
LGSALVTTVRNREMQSRVNLAIDLNALADAPAQPGVGSFQFDGVDLNLFTLDAAPRAHLLQSCCAKE